MIERKFKGMILAGGRGTRFGELTSRIPKPLLPVAGKPLICHNIDLLAHAGIGEITIVISPDSVQIEEALGDGSALGVSLSYILQEEHLGTAHAIGLGKDYIGSDAFVVCWSDNMTDWPMSRLIDDYIANPGAGTLALHTTDTPKKGGCAVTDGPYVIDFEEKSENPRSDLNLAGMYILDPMIFDAIAEVKPSKTGEYYLPDAFQILVDGGNPLRWVYIDSWRMNVNDVADLLAANRMILTSVGSNGHSADGYTTLAPVIVPDCAKVGSGAQIGPHVSVGLGCSIGEDSRLENAIIMDGARIEAGVVICGAIVDELGEVHFSN